MVDGNFHIGTEILVFNDGINQLERWKTSH